MMVMHGQFCNCQWYTIQTFALLQKKEIYLHTPLQPACWFIHVACPSPTLSLAQCCTRLHTAALSESCESCCGVVYCGVQWGCVLCLCAPVGQSGCSLHTSQVSPSKHRNKKILSHQQKIPFSKHGIEELCIIAALTSFHSIPYSLCLAVPILPLWWESWKGDY